ncbi:MAG: ABC transporter ATP-binding protein/permease [Chthoniobacterales bacterium]|nr:ABC transporter ATP-binding protein/permease [Chthoniobacterales bacterium]
MTLPKTTFPFIFHFLSQQWGKVLLATIASAFWGIYNALFPFFLKELINVLGSHHLPTARIYTASITIVSLIIGLWIVAHLLHNLQGFIFRVEFCARFRASIREALFKYVQTHSSSYFATHFSGTIANKISDVPTNCETLVNMMCCEFTTALVMAFTIFITMWMSHPPFAILLITWLSLHFVITFFFLQKANSLLEEHANAVTKISGRIVDVFSNILNVKLFAREKKEQESFHQVQVEEIQKSNQAYLYLEWTQVGYSLNHTFLIVGMLFLLIYGWQHRWVTLGDFTQIMMQSFYLSGWVWFVSDQIKYFIKNAATVNSALSLIQKPHDIIDTPHALALQVSRGEITFNKVHFSYPGNHSVFTDLTVTLAAGKKVGLVGLSGAGKTTFMNLLLRLYDLQAGTIFIDHQSINSVTQESLHQNIAVIPQDVSLFHRSLMENIRYGRLDATDEEVITASKQAHCHEFIKELDEQYESLVGERGIKLSGGQRQRIAIARALLKNAPILILDEATSSLDSSTEKKIQESLHLLMENRTTVVIAHRLSTLAAMDRILVFHQGNIVEDGTIQELIEMRGHFEALWNIQQHQEVSPDSLSMIPLSREQ